VIVLGIDTSTILGGVALAEGPRLLGESRCDARAAASERILPQIERLLEDLGLGRAAIGRIGVALGPGSFTGVRVGLATAKGLALGFGVPVLGVSSLEARVFSLGAPGRAVLIASAPRRGEIFAGAGWWDDAGYHAILPEACRPLAEAAGWVGEALHGAAGLGRLPLLGVGDGIATLRAQLGEAGDAIEARGFAPLPAWGAGSVPGAVALLTARASESALREGAALDSLLPVYLRGGTVRRGGAPSISHPGEDA
jgi:tRNA threonylcarbamoyladenosine biosynthesis protein TsaB